MTTTDDVLFHVNGATEGTLQWKAETFQLVNWGGFEGRVRFDFHPGSTLISGASGTGKSTLLDAYIALMMPSDTSFNGASNDAVGGRARSAEQRNLLSYLRGQTDTTADADGKEKPKVLRGDKTATWGAVGMTFVDDHGRRFTAFRAYYVPARARRSGDFTMRMATFDGVLDLADLAGHTEQAFAPKALKAAFPGLRTWDSYAAFANVLHTRLGIGANGDGAKALRLLVRIQSGHQIRTVDELYKEMVLERPVTFAAADRAIGHFDDLDAAYRAMQTEQEKADLLAPITDLHARLHTSRAEVETIDTFGLTRDGDTPIRLWSLRTEADLLTDAADANRDARITNTADLKLARDDEGGLTRDLEATQEEHRTSGGADLEQLATTIETEQHLRDQRLGHRADLAERTTVLEAPLDNREDFDKLRSAAGAFLATYDKTDAELGKQRDALFQEQFPLLERRRQLKDERASFEGRAGRVPKDLNDMRLDAAAAAGIEPSELPFLAELIDVDPAQARWRTAIETVLGGSARLMLVPRERLDDFSRKIDSLHLRGRLMFEGVPSVEHREVTGDPSTVAGKLLFKDHRFSEWVVQHVTSSARNAHCVETADELAGGGYRVTLAGQTRRGTSGSHGRNNRTNVIGFSSDEAISDIDQQLDELIVEIKQLDTQRAGIEAKRSALSRTNRAYEEVQRVNWDDIDVASTERRISELKARRNAILTANDRLRALEDQIKELNTRLETARGHRFGLERHTKDLRDRHGDLVDRQDKVSTELDRIEHEQKVILDNAQSIRLDKEFAEAAAPGDPASLDQFLTNLGHLRKRLTNAVAGARTDVERIEAELTRIFQSYQRHWDDPNLGSSAASYPDYARILDNIITTGLHERRDEWRRRLVRWNGQDLVPLSGAMDAAVEDIEDRLAPINDILAALPFGAGRDRLRIKLRHLTPDHVTQFRRELRTLSSTATKELEESQLVRRFAELQRFMGQLRCRDDPRADADLTDRDRLLDVRRHVEITAERYSSDGVLLSVHSALGGKSGGESQELVAFIVGAALRFRLGDELRARPRFAPVFLDEGFVKSDSEFAGRAVQAWKGLGFQLIVGAPLDKVTALEPHMDELLAITKDTKTGYSFVAHIKDSVDEQELR
ncbi:ATP-binding protein [Amycolatopsis sp. H20-H5]|uniref:ATP-binding protein n=1 Tax=Amycolatopsis sp. H20-H5 TaxID=3046309 RepID=UPI002DBD2C26|nr:ATP-binding protein [Amycolatopsis sp. H20-H5]MEC3979826.1 ATP-binding protein [Amycolatopsis sp. H20-H5]